MRSCVQKPLTRSWAYATIQPSTCLPLIIIIRSVTWLRARKPCAAQPTSSRRKVRDLHCYTKEEARKKGQEAERGPCRQPSSEVGAFS